MVGESTRGRVDDDGNELLFNSERGGGRGGGEPRRR
jgi:hypothetical protein